MATYQLLLRTLPMAICIVMLAYGDVEGQIQDKKKIEVKTGVAAKLEGVRIDEKLGNMIPLDLVFQDEQGVTKKLSDVIAGSKPVLLTLNYSGCPGLCVAQLDGLVQGVEALGDVALGKDFELISISIDPRETKEKAQATKLKYTKGLTKPHDPAAWHFWTGSQKSIDRITDEVGFRYTYDKRNDRYNHNAVAVAISPKGKITRYLYEISYEPTTMKMSLIEASEGTVGTPFDSFVLWCMHYDSNENRYTADARKLLSVTAGVFALVVFVSIVPFWFAVKPNPNPTNESAANNESEVNKTTNDPLPTDVANPTESNV